jgi:hypothetical protein
MFSQFTFNRLASHDDEKANFMFFKLFFIFLGGAFSLSSYADTPTENKVRNAVVHQLILMGGKSPAELKREEKAKEEIVSTIENDIQQIKTASKESHKKISKEASESKVAVSLPTKEDKEGNKKEASQPAKNKTKEASYASATTSPSKSEKKEKIVLKKVASEKKVSKEKKQVVASKATKEKPLALNEAKKEQATPVVEILTEKELQSLMQDVMKVSGRIETPQTAAIKSVSSDNKQKAVATKIANEEKIVNKKDKLSTNNGKDSSIFVKKEASEPTSKVPQKKSKIADNKTTPPSKTASSDVKIMPLGRIQLGRNTADAASTTSTKTTKATKTATAPKQATGWIYLGQFQSKQWQNPTLEIEKQLPKIGEKYIIKATMVNVRNALPKKGLMGKTTKALKHKDIVKILKLRGLGRNRVHYWANIAYK